MAAVHLAIFVSKPATCEGSDDPRNTAADSKPETDLTRRKFMRALKENRGPSRFAIAQKRSHRPADCEHDERARGEDFLEGFRRRNRRLWFGSLDIRGHPRIPQNQKNQCRQR